MKSETIECCSIVRFEGFEAFSSEVEWAMERDAVSQSSTIRKLLDSHSPRFLRVLLFQTQLVVISSRSDVCSVSDGIQSVDSELLGRSFAQEELGLVDRYTQRVPEKGRVREEDTSDEL